MDQPEAVEAAMAALDRDDELHAIRDPFGSADVSVEVQWTEDIAGWVSENATEDLVIKSAHHSKTLTHTPLDWQLLRELIICMRMQRMCKCSCAGWSWF